MIYPSHVLMASGPGGGPYGGDPYGGMPGGPYGGMPGAPPLGGPPGFGPPGQGPTPGGMVGPPGAGGPRTDALAIVSLVAGVIGLLIGMVNIFFMVFGACCALCTVGATFIGVMALVPSVIGAVCGGLSLKRVKERPHELQGKGLAIAGTIVSGVGVLLALVTIILPWLGLGCLAANGAVNHPPGGTPPSWQPAPAPLPAPAPVPAPAPAPAPVAPPPLPPVGGTP
ncbi:MAG: DUF4190 domain-containing protein [Sandaracinaceae bacterium]